MKISSEFWGRRGLEGLWVVFWVVVVMQVVSCARSIRLEEEKTEQIRMILELERMRGTQMEKGTLGKKSAKKSEVEF